MLCLDPSAYRLWAYLLKTTQPDFYSLACSVSRHTSRLFALQIFHWCAILFLTIFLSVAHIFGYNGNSGKFEQSACMGGQPFQPMPANSSPIANEQDQATLVAHGQQNAQVQPLSQTGVIASCSENLFHPVSHDSSLYIFKLPNVPMNLCFHAYNPLDTFQCPVPYRPPFSSYNNLVFRVPSNSPRALYNQVITSPVTAPLPQPSSVPCIHSHPVFSSQPQFQSAYNHTPLPVFNQPQPTYNPPPVFNQPQLTYNPPPIFNQFPHVQPVQYFNQSPPVPITSPTLSSSKALPTVAHIQPLKSRLLCLG